jgi:hypothetical protein
LTVAINPTYELIKHDVLSALTHEWRVIDEIAAISGNTPKVTGMVLTGFHFKGKVEWRPVKPAQYRLPSPGTSGEGSRVGTPVNAGPLVRNKGSARNP